MKDKIIALLLAAFAGVRKDGLSVLAGSLALQANTEDEAKELVGKLTAENVNSFVTDWRKDADAEISRSNSTYEQGLKKKYDFVEKKSQDPAPDPTPAPGVFDAAAMQKVIADAVEAAVKPLQEKITGFESNSVSTTRKDKLTEAIKDTPKSYQDSILTSFGNMTFADDTAFQGYLDTTKQNVAALTQELADQGLSGHQKPTFGSANNEGVSSAVADYIKTKAEPSGAFVGKEV